MTAKFFPFLVALCIFGTSAVRADPAACGLTQLAEVDMQTTMDGRVQIPVKVQDHDYMFMVDTGGEFTTVAPLAARALDLSQRHAGFTQGGIGMRELKKDIVVQDFSIGILHGKNFDFFVNVPMGSGSDGTLSPDIMRGYDVDLDFAHEKFKFFSHDHCPGQVVYWTTDPYVTVPLVMGAASYDGHIRVRITLDGKPMTAMLDTGAANSIMSMSAASQFLGIDEKTPGLKSLGEKTVNGVKAKVYTYPFATLDFDGIAVRQPYIEIIPNDVAKRLDRELILGADVMRQLHMYIAYKEMKLYLTPALAH